jgi:hypothetical protein
MIPGERMLQTQFEEFHRVLATFVKDIGYTLDTLPFLNLLDIVEESVAQQLT